MSETATIKPKYWNLSAYRLFATLCVLLFHIFYLLLPYSVPHVVLLSKGVQGLTALSGFLYSQKVITDHKKFYTKNIIKLIIPALLCVIFVATLDLIYFLFGHIGNFQDYISLFTSPLPATGRLLTQFDNFYYLGFLLLCYLMLPILHKSWNDKSPWAIAIIGVLFIGELVLDYFLGWPTTIISFIIGFYIGKIFFNNYTNLEQKVGLPATLVAVLMTFVSLAIHFIVFYLMPANKGRYLISNFIQCIFGVGTAFLFAILFKKINKINNIPVFKFTDKICLYVYLLNQTFMVGATNLTQYIPIFAVACIVIYITTIVAASALYLLDSLIMKGIANKKEKNSDPKPE